jgi:hypothetical protein
MYLRRLVATIACASAAFSLPSISHACSGSLHVELREAGVYTLDHAAIVAAEPGLDGCASADLELTRAGDEVPIRIVGDKDGRFAAGARIEWVGEPLHGPESWYNPFATFNVYLLSAVSGEHERMREFAAAPANAVAAPLLRRVHLEQQELLVRLDRATMKPGDEPDFWQWAKLTNADAQWFEIRFDLDDLARPDRASTTAVVTLALRGMSNIPRRAGKVDETPDHVVELVLNGEPLPTLEWDGRDEERMQVELPLASLEATGNTLALRTPKRNNRAWPDKPVVDVVVLNWADLVYPIGGDLDRGKAPFEAAGEGGSRAIEVLRGESGNVAFYSDAGEFRLADASGGDRIRFMATEGATIHVVADEDLRRPARVRKVAASNLRAAEPGFDYLMISHPNLMEAVQPLAEFHRQRGMRVAVVSVDDIYDQFHAGISHPAAIRDFIAWGREHWQVKPRYVLLVGTASFDLRHAIDSSYNEHQVQDPRTGTGKVQRTDTALLAEFPHPGEAVPDRNLIPTWQYPSPQGQSATDNPYVALGESDFHPTIAIGRFPVVTPEDVAAIVRKTIDYATHPAPGAWRSKVMFITNESKHFHRASDRIAEDIERQGFTAEKVYASADEADNLQHQATIKSNLNDGSLLVHFLGHGGRFIWRSGPPDFRKNHDLFTLDDVSALHNGNRLPMVLSMTCYSGSFDNPNSDTIGERFLREPDRGAVAVLAASWSNAPSATFSKDLVDRLLQPGMRIGDAIVAAKGNSRDRVLVETYNLFGDPALVLDRPRGDIGIARAPDRWNDRIAVRLPRDRFDGKVTVNWLDEGGEALASHTYAADGNLFVLPVPSPNIAGVNIYAEDLTSGADALGFLDLRPPAPEPEITQPREPVPEAKPKKVAARPAQPRPSNLPDKIGSFDFEYSAVTVLPASADVAAKGGGAAAGVAASAAAVAVDPGTGKGQP